MRASAGTGRHSDMDTANVVSLTVGIIGAVAGLYAALTKASSGRVDSLCQIIDALQDEVSRLRARILFLERENCVLREILDHIGVDPDEEIMRRENGRANSNHTA